MPRRSSATASPASSCSTATSTASTKTATGAASTSRRARSSGVRRACRGSSRPAWSPPTARAAKRSADVVVYGGTASGAIAAVAVAREGKSVLLLEPGKHVGGMVTGGLGATDVGNRGAIGGYSREFFERVRLYYAKR